MLHSIDDGMRKSASGQLAAAANLSRRLHLQFYTQAILTCYLQLLAAASTSQCYKQQWQQHQQPKYPTKQQHSFTDEQILQTDFMLQTPTGESQKSN